MSAITGQGVPAALQALVEVIGEAPVSIKAKGAGVAAVAAEPLGALSEPIP
jgi:GTP-binding protein